ncbi:hypothetical protein HW115_08875 [Verrucomicrobiaceae bacterium N1E253]|uniref:Uncharacterized protein n=1 Tax=Oceaniferula marina TaxID=2748318 RepID=A0A851GIM0_9BACT|nr:hypothetical protein [Oceaniferula marina]NWK55721.1 hypothetical protein [Oceaniferula marina]
MKIFILLLLVLGLVLLPVFGKRWMAKMPEGFRKWLPKVVGVLGVVVFLAMVLNSVFTVQRDLADLSPEESVKVAVASQELDPEKVTLSDLDVHLVRVDTKGSLVASDWEVRQWRVPAIEGFSSFRAGGDLEVSLDTYHISRGALDYTYATQTSHSSASGSSGGQSLSQVLQPYPLHRLNPSLPMSIVLIGVPEVREESRLYFFLTHKDDPLKELAVDALTPELGELSRNDYLLEINLPMDRFGQRAPMGVQWLGSLGGAVLVMIGALVMASYLFPWRFSYTFTAALVLCILTSIALDRWRVQFASEMSQDSRKSAVTRYLAMQHLRSSFFWKPTAAEAFHSANTEGFDEVMLDVVRRGKVELPLKD